MMAMIKVYLFPCGWLGTALFALLRGLPVEIGTALFASLRGLPVEIGTARMSARPASDQAVVVGIQDGSGGFVGKNH